MYYVLALLYLKFEQFGGHFRCGKRVFKLKDDAYKKYQLRCPLFSISGLQLSRPSSPLHLVDFLRLLLQKMNQVTTCIQHSYSSNDCNSFEVII